MRRAAYFVALLVTACGPAQKHDPISHPVAHVPDAGAPVAEVPVSEAECRQISDHARDLAIAAKGSGANEADAAYMKEHPVAFDCGGMTRAKWKCGVGAASLDELAACDG